VGIMNAGSSRLEQHRRSGRSVHETAYVPVDWLAYEAERAVLNHWGASDWPPAIANPDTTMH
jgi:hypothetical protein